MLSFGVSYGCKGSYTLQIKIIFSAILANYIARMKYQQRHFIGYDY